MASAEPITGPWKTFQVGTAGYSVSIPELVHPSPIDVPTQSCDDLRQSKLIGFLPAGDLSVEAVQHSYRPDLAAYTELHLQIARSTAPGFVVSDRPVTVGGLSGHEYTASAAGQDFHDRWLVDGTWVVELHASGLTPADATRFLDSIAILPAPSASPSVAPFQCTSAGGRFTITFPLTPERTAPPDRNGQGTYYAREGTTVLAGATYVLKAKDPTPIFQVLQTLEAQATKTGNLTVISSASITRSGVEGLDVVGRRADGVEIREQFFAAADRLLFLLAQADPRTDAFFNSLQILP
jgi:hypothetical protein